MKGAMDVIVEEEARSGRFEKEVKEMSVDLTLNEPLPGNTKRRQTCKSEPAVTVAEDVWGTATRMTVAISLL